MNKFESNDKEKKEEEPDYSGWDAIAKEKVEPGPHIEEFEKLFTSVTNETFEVLNALEIEEAAENSEERKFAKGVLGSLQDKIKFLEKRTNITEDELAELNRKYKVISNAVGIIERDGKVNHTG